VKKSCVEWLIDLDRRIPSVVARVAEHNQHDIIGASVSIDGAPVASDGRPVQLDPGMHTIVASAPGWPRSERTFLLAEREQVRLLLMELRRPEPPAPTPPRESARFRVPRASWILGGLGVAGIASFAVLRVEAGRELDHLRDSCSPDCPHARTERGRHDALAADLSLGIGVAAIAGAGAWALGSWLWQRERAAGIAWAPLRGGAFASVAVSY
jgi:hypothetical protein